MDEWKNTDNNNLPVYVRIISSSLNVDLCKKNQIGKILATLSFTHQMGLLKKEMNSSGYLSSGILK